MARPEITGKAPANPPPRAAYSIAEFCDAHSISESFYYKIREAGQGPREKRVLSRVLITAEDAAAWRRKRAVTDSAA
jgi:hypothetical protein